MANLHSSDNVAEVLAEQHDGNGNARVDDGHIEGIDGAEELNVEGAVLCVENLSSGLNDDVGADDDQCAFEVGCKRY